MNVTMIRRMFIVCQKSSAGWMIARDNRQCHFKWFQYTCVGIKRAPNGSWFCLACEKRNYDHEVALVCINYCNIK